MSLSTITMPVLVQTSISKPLLLQQWAEIFNKGHVQGPVLAILTSATYGYATWLHVTSGENWAPSAIAGALTLSIVPFTWIFLGKINYALFDALDDRDKDAKMDRKMAERMIVSWTKLHAVRSALPLVGAMVGFLGMLRCF